MHAPLPNVEPAHLDILGSIPIEGNGLLPPMGLSQLGNELGGQLLPQSPGTLPSLQNMPSIKLPQFTQPLLKP